MRTAIISFGVSALVLAAPAMAAPPASTDLTIEYSFAEVFGETEAFSGEVISEKNRCEDGRKVRVFLKKAGRDKLIGSDTSQDVVNDQDGFWAVILDDEGPGPDAKPGRYYAIAAASARCERGVSGIERVAVG